MTQAHTTVLLNEAVTQMVHKPSGTYLDGTFGRGGHSLAVLSMLAPAGRLIAIDRDPTAYAVGRAWTDVRFTMLHCAFSDMGSQLQALGIAQLDGILLDLGVSSPQLDEAVRGFSFSKDAPLDMRMDTSCGQTAAQFLACASESELTRIIHEYGEERHAARIAAHIVARRAIEPITTTGQLAKLVEGAVKARKFGFHPATLTFQAIRIHINQELAELESALSQAQVCLGDGGRLAIISFHSLEDRRVKQAFRPAPVSAALRHLPRQETLHPWKEIARIKPTEAQCKANPRARSAVLRVALRQTSGGHA
jgi:16S rRNA (cytosine1402-N4)-methyltransferase